MRSRTFFVPFVVATFALTAACGGSSHGLGGDDDVGTAIETPTPFPNDASASPMLQGPASLYSISQDDLGQGYITDIDYTWDLDADSYGGTSTFDGVDGPALLKSWGYLDGYETSYTPEGRAGAVLNGAHSIKVETHLMSNEDGAKQLFSYFKDVLSKSVSEPVTALAIGNEYSAWRYIDTKNGVNGSDIPGEFHQYLFRRGNLVAVVLTWGAEPFMDVSTAYSLAHVIDEKALGKLALVEPTPVATATGN